MDQAPKRPVPVFPMPGTVLFPGAEMHLRIFELRYRTMVRDALSSERLIAIATLAPGWEHDYQGSPPFHDLGCVAHFEDVEWLPNDHYQLRVRGGIRVRFGRVVREYPYRACAVEAMRDAPYSESDPLIGMVRRELLEERARLAPLGPEAWVAPPQFAPNAGLQEMVGALATAVRLSVADKLILLEEESIVDRARRLCDHLRTLGRGPGAPPPPPELGRN